MVALYRCLLLLIVFMFLLLCFSFGQGATTGRGWTVKASLPTPRGETGAAVVDGLSQVWVDSQNRLRKDLRGSKNSNRPPE